MSKSEWQANQDLAATPRRRVNGQQTAVFIPRGEVIKVIGALSVGLGLIAVADRLAPYVEAGFTWLSVAIVGS